MFQRKALAEQLINGILKKISCTRFPEDHEYGSGGWCIAKGAVSVHQPGDARLVQRNGCIIV